MSLKPIFLLAILLCSQLQAKPFLLMLDPSGDSNDTGRLIDGVFERSLALACAQELKQELENTIPALQVVLTREAGEALEPLQNAHFANRLDVDLFVRLQFFHEKTAQDTVALYYFSWGDECAIRAGHTAFIRYDKAHLVNLNTTAAWAHHLEQAFMACCGCKGIFAMPCRPLIGITAPAICIEIGMSSKQNWHAQAKNIGKALTELINKVA